MQYEKLAEEVSKLLLDPSYPKDGQPLGWFFTQAKLKGAIPETARVLDDTAIRTAVFELRDFGVHITDRQHVQISDAESLRQKFQPRQDQRN